MLRSAVLLSLGLLFACTAPAPISRTLPVTDAFGSYTLGWSVGGSLLVIRLSVLTNENGVMEVCGAYANQGSQMREHSRAVLSDLGVTADGQVILSDLSFFTRVRAPEDIVGSAATCQSSGVPRPAGEVEFGVHNGATGSYRV